MRWIVLIAFFLHDFIALSQCSPAPPADPLTCGSSGTAFGNNANINSGNTFFHCSTSGSFGGLNLNGGELVICGNVTITSANLNSGRLIITRSATVTFSNNVTLNNGVTLVNYGTLNINGNLEFQNNENYFYNAATDAQATISGTIIFAQNDNQTGYLFNRGYLTSGAFQVRNGVRTFCLEDGSTIRTTNFVLDNMSENNPITYGSGTTGTARIRYTNNFTINNNIPLTASSNINICRAPSASVIGGSGNRGSATLTSGCSDIAAPTAQPSSMGCTPLHAQLIDFKIEKRNKNEVLLIWSTAQEINFEHFIIEKSTDAQNFKPITTIKGKGNGNIQAYNFIDKEVNTAYYRLKKVDKNGNFEYSKTISNVVKDNQESLEIHISPNPASAIIEIRISKIGTWNIELCSVLGDVLDSYTFENQDLITLDIGKFEKGTYLLKCTNGKEIIIKKLIIQ
ncbi:MAG: T9SS type A sorting domain-containing protein [Raineya sp.]|jgi:hypothetical protein|nr:T9SS type A sorting domain-containing protein [Raineya sp.]